MGDPFRNNPDLVNVLQGQIGFYQEALHFVMPAQPTPRPAPNDLATKLSDDPTMMHQAGLSSPAQTKAS